MWRGMVADGLLIIHVLWVVFMITGFPLAIILRSAMIRFIHTIGLSSYIILAFFKVACPVTYGEEYFRQLEQPDFTYQGSFLVSLLEKLIYVENWGASLWWFHVAAGIYLFVVLSSWWWLKLPAKKVTTK